MSDCISVSSHKYISLPQIVSDPDYKTRSAIFFEGQNGKKMSVVSRRWTVDGGKKTVVGGQKTEDNRPQTTDHSPILEFKKINPTKYRIIIHKAKEAFPLVFSESFHEGWKAYLVGGRWTVVRRQQPKVHSLSSTVHSPVLALKIPTAVMILNWWWNSDPRDFSISDYLLAEQIY